MSGLDWFVHSGDSLLHDLFIDLKHSEVKKMTKVYLTHTHKTKVNSFSIYLQILVFSFSFVYIYIMSIHVLWNVFSEIKTSYLILSYNCKVSLIKHILIKLTLHLFWRVRKISSQNSSVNKCRRVNFVFYAYKALSRALCHWLFQNIHVVHLQKSIFEICFFVFCLFCFVCFVCCCWVGCFSFQHVGMCTSHVPPHPNPFYH